MKTTESEVQLFMKPVLTPYASSIWNNTLQLLDGENLHPTDYVLLEAFCHTADQLRQMSDKIKQQPFTIVDGMIKVNQIQWSSASAVKTLTLLSDKLGLNRVMRKAGNDGTSSELLEFLRGGDGDAKDSVPAQV